MEEKLQIEREQYLLAADRNPIMYSMIFSGLALLFLLIFFRILYQELRRRFEEQLMLEQSITELKRANIEYWSNFQTFLLTIYNSLCVKSGHLANDYC